MIRVEHGDVQIKGSMSQIMTDVSVMIKSVRDTFVSESGMREEIADVLIKHCVKLGLATDEEVKKTAEAVEKGWVQPGMELLKALANNF